MTELLPQLGFQTVGQSFDNLDGVALLDRGAEEERKAALEAAGNELTAELFEYWTQNDGLRVELDIEFRPVESNPARQPAPYLQVRVRNDRHQVTLNMNQRSKGFIWFFSFLAAFSEYADEKRRIILLDEPGLNLHAKAQGDLLRYIDDRLATTHQVIYSTHSLFMIVPTKLERCRTVEDVDNIGTVVSEEVWDARPDTVFPLLGALGVDMAQTLIIGSDQLLLEGPADVVYLGRGLHSRRSSKPGARRRHPSIVCSTRIKICRDAFLGCNSSHKRTWRRPWRQRRGERNLLLSGFPF